MLRVLLWKEWRQLRQLRWVGAGLGLVLAFVALTAPAGAKQGWIPFTPPGGDYSSTEIVMKALPIALALALWPLLALLMTAECFAGDRASGTESFLLERPVARGGVWLARTVASFGSTATVVAASAVMWWLLAVTVATPKAADWEQAAKMLWAAGGATTVACLLGGMVAASLLSQPLAALLLGVVLVMIPVQIATTLGAWSHQARVGDIQVGLFVPLLLMLAYPVASYRASCRGEPAGRGRIARGATTVIAGLVAAGLLFAASATVAVRAVALKLEHGADLTVSPSGQALVAQPSTSWLAGGWIVDLDAADRVRFLPPPLGAVAWSEDGSRVAVMTSAGPFGSSTAGIRLEFFDSAGRIAGRTLDFEEGFYTPWLRWVGNRVVWVEPSMKSTSRIETYDPATGERNGSDFDLATWSYGLVGPTRDGKLYLAIPKEKPAAASDALDRSRAIPYAVLPFDPLTGKLGDGPLVEDVGSPWMAERLLSRSGRYWVRDLPQDGVRVVLDLQTGAAIPVEGLGRGALWTEGDFLVWVERGPQSRVARTSPGGAIETLREWTGAWVELGVSPDGRRLLVNVAGTPTPPQLGESGSGDPVHRRPLETWVHTVATGEWARFDAWPDREVEGLSYRTVWAGPETIARTGPGILALESLARPGELRFVIGSSSD